MTRIKAWRQRLFLIGLSLVALCLSSCGTLDPSGPYSSNRILYDADVVIDTSYVIIHEFVAWEYANRPYNMATHPKITKVADKIRMEAPKAFATAIAARDAYETIPSEDTKNALKSSVAVLKALAAEARRYLISQPMEPK